MARLLFIEVFTEEGRLMQSLSRRQFLALGGAAAAAAAHSAPPALPCHAAPALLSPAMPRWIDHQSYGPIQCHATFPLGNLTPLFQELSALELELQRTLAVPPAAKTIDVHLVENKTHAPRAAQSAFSERALSPSVVRAKRGAWQRLRVSA